MSGKCDRNRNKDPEAALLNPRRAVPSALGFLMSRTCGAFGIFVSLSNKKWLRKSGRLYAF